MDKRRIGWILLAGLIVLITSHTLKIWFGNDRPAMFLKKAGLLEQVQFVQGVDILWGTTSFPFRAFDVGICFVRPDQPVVNGKKIPAFTPLQPGAADRYLQGISAGTFPAGCRDRGDYWYPDRRRCVCIIKPVF
jgi:hypothetical protein